MSNKSLAEARKALGEHLLASGPILAQYVETAKKHADLSIDVLEALAREVVPAAVPGKALRHIATLTMKNDLPADFERKLRATMEKVEIVAAIPCRHTAALYLFGRDK